jgi:ketosteroid isomerase-like protein
VSPNLDIVRSIFVDWERGDFSSAEWAHPEIEFVLPGEGPDTGVWTGLDGMAEAWRRFLSVWDDVRPEAYEYRELDDERVLVLTHAKGRGKTSGLELGQIHAGGVLVFNLCKGKVTKLVIYGDRDRDDALADLGLKE